MDKDISEKHITIIFKAEELSPSMSHNFQFCIRDNILLVYGGKNVQNYRVSE